MAVVAELMIPAAGFDLGRVTNVSGAHIELERVVPMGTDVMPFFWAVTEDFVEFERSVRDEQLVEELTALARVGDRVLYHVIWGDTVANLTEILFESQATILEAFGNHSWLFRLRFPDHRGLRTFHNACREQEIEFAIERIYTLDEEQDTKYHFNLSPEQREALVLALERDYFGVPRGATLTEIADELGISQQAASERVRRATNEVLSKVLLSRSAADL
jgi:predicted DNA binding protein